MVYQMVGLIVLYAQQHVQVVKSQFLIHQLMCQMHARIKAIVILEFIEIFLLLTL
jgi:hypothetical protein